ncbi:hypothetical protein [Asanoa iriomotensis]|uniref:hypothetical protein n=1 Tax=Asanoa iriomotensis TaxID=234613 RepID=UPI00194079FB|nr:hypothetical protein [Asanoa iriomotensis]
MSLADLWGSLSHYPEAYLVAAAAVLLLALRAARQALVPVEPIVRALAAVVGVAFAAGVAFVVVIAVVVSGS